MRQEVTASDDFRACRRASGSRSLPEQGERLGELGQTSDQRLLLLVRFGSFANLGDDARLSVGEAAALEYQIRILSAEMRMS